MLQIWTSSLITLFNYMVVVLSIFSTRDVSCLSYLHGKKLMPIRIMNSVGLNNKNIVSDINIFNDIWKE